MACGCNKKNQRRSLPAITAGGSLPSGSRIRLNNNVNNNNNNNAVSAQSKVSRAKNLNEGGISAEKRKVQAIRRNEILKRLGKR